MRLTPEVEAAILARLQTTHGEWSYVLRNYLVSSKVVEARVDTAQVSRWLRRLEGEGKVDRNGRTCSVKYIGWRRTQVGAREAAT